MPRAFQPDVRSSGTRPRSESDCSSSPFDAGATKARDLLGEVYEYFLGKFAAAAGKRGGAFYTPPGVVRVLVEMLEPQAGRIYEATKDAFDKAYCFD